MLTGLTGTCRRCRLRRPDRPAGTGLGELGGLTRLSGLRGSARCGPGGGLGAGARAGRCLVARWGGARRLVQGPGGGSGLRGTRRSDRSTGGSGAGRGGGCGTATVQVGRGRNLDRRDRRLVHRTPRQCFGAVRRSRWNYPAIGGTTRAGRGGARCDGLVSAEVVAGFVGCHTSKLPARHLDEGNLDAESSWRTSQPRSSTRGAAGATGGCSVRARRTTAAITATTARTADAARPVALFDMHSACQVGGRGATRRGWMDL